MKTKSANGLFLVVCLAITAGFIWAYAQFSTYFASHGETEFVAQHSTESLRKEQFARELAEARLRDLSQEVAAVLPADAKRKLASSGYELRTLGDTMREPASIPLDLSGVQMERAKKLFGDKKYTDAAKEFEKLVKEYPSSPNALEAYFLLGESSYLVKDEKRTVEIADLMMSQYPEHELTGFMMLRLGQISEKNSHGEEAGEIYRVVAKNFKNNALVEQAHLLEKSLEAQ